MPARCERAGLRLAVADDAGDDADPDCRRRPRRRARARSRALRPRGSSRASPAPRDLESHRDRRTAGRARAALPLPRRRWVQLAVCPLQVRVRDVGRPAVARARDEDRVQVAHSDRAVQMRIDEVEARHGSEVAEQPRFHVLGLQRLPQERIAEQVDLPDREIVRGAPVAVEQLEVFAGQARPAPTSCLHLLIDQQCVIVPLGLPTFRRPTWPLAGDEDVLRCRPAAGLPSAGRRLRRTSRSRYAPRPAHINRAKNPIATRSSIGEDVVRRDTRPWVCSFDLFGVSNRT